VSGICDQMRPELVIISLRNTQIVLKREIEANTFYETLKKDAQAVAQKKGLTSISFEEVLEYGAYSSKNDEFAERINQAKMEGRKLTSLDVVQCHMQGIMYLPPETIAKKILAYSRFIPIGSNTFFSMESALSRLKNSKLIELVKNGKLDSSNAFEIDTKLGFNPTLEPLVNLLVSPLGLKMMRKNYISGWFSIIYFSEDSLKLIISPLGFKLFEDNHIQSMGQLVHIHPSYYHKLFSEKGLKLFTAGKLFVSESGMLQNAQREFLDPEQFEQLFESISDQGNTLSATL
ncbi:hypothetical protein DGG96_18770, partial [Legionella qingyii]